MKTCKKCGLEQPVENYYTVDGTRRRAQCKTCELQGIKDRRKADPEFVRNSWIRNLKYYYGLTPEQYEQMLASQNGACAICKSTEPDRTGYKKYFSVDHNHNCCSKQKTCGKCVRGLLCQQCNGFIGQVKEDTVRLQSMINYIISNVLLH